MRIDPATCRPLIDATWPPARMEACGPWVVRTGAGGGKRVSAATTRGAVAAADIATAERAMTEAGDDPLFSVGAGQADLDALLAHGGYVHVDPTRLLQCEVDALADPAPPPGSGFSVWPPLRIQHDLWSAGGIGPSRIAVMERVAGPRTTLLGRVRDQPAAAAFVAVHDGIAMLHALEVRRDLRRFGMGRHLVRHAARWARDQGATLLTALVVEANTGARALYAGLGMEDAACYHYRARP